MNSPNPALVTQREAAAAAAAGAACCSAPPTCCPGCSGATRGRTPTSPRSATSLGIAQGRTSWLAPTVGGLPGRRRAAAVLDRRGVRQGSCPWLDPALAARVPFALLLALALALTWYAPSIWRAPRPRSRCRSRSAARPTPVDYARAIADGAAAGPDRHARPAAARPRDDAGAGRSSRALALYLYGLAASAPTRPRRADSPRSWRCRCWPPAARRASPCCWQRSAPRWRCARATRAACAAMRLDRRRRRCSRAAAARCLAPGRTGSAPIDRAAQCLSLLRLSPGSLGRPGCWRCGRCGAGAGTCSAHTSSCRWAAPRRCSCAGSRWAASTAR